MKRDRPPVVQGTIDTTYQTQQRDMFTSGLAAQIGSSAYIVWNAIKYHADFNTGQCWPGIRRLADLTGTAKQTVQDALTTLKDAHLLRITKKGQRNIYVARERVDVKVGDRVICTVVIDFVPAAMRERLNALKAAGGGDLSKQDVWAQVDLIPGPGMQLDIAAGVYRAELRADEIPDEAELPSTKGCVTDARASLKAIADQMRTATVKLPSASAPSSSLGQR